jgi:hypothetical protein
VGSRAGLEEMAMRKTIYPSRESKPGLSARSLVTILTEHSLIFSILCVISYKLTIYIEQKLTVVQVVKNLTRLLGNSKIKYHVHKSLSLVSTAKLMNSPHNTSLIISSISIYTSLEVSIYILCISHRPIRATCTAHLILP